MNIGKGTRWALRQLLGTQKGIEVIEFLESGLAEAFKALKSGDVIGFIAALPKDLREKLLSHFIKNG